MKTVNKILQIAALAFGVLALVCFAYPGFVKLIANGENVALSGLQVAFGTEVNEALGSIAKSAKVLFSFLLTVLSVALTVFTFFRKSDALKYWLSGISLGNAIYVLVFVLGNPWKFIDSRLANAYVATESLDFGVTAFYLLAALCAFAVLSIAFMLVSDLIAVSASKGAKLTLIKRVIRFFKDYKSEIKKIVWPGFSDVLKNTVIVLIMCVIIGLFVWAIDFGLGTLLSALWG